MSSPNLPILSTFMVRNGECYLPLVAHQLLLAIVPPLNPKKSLNILAQAHRHLLTQAEPHINYVKY